jgi:hypothetical protein
MPRPALHALLALTLLFGCDAQTDAGYPGEPLVTLHGRVESSGALPPLEAAMLWQRGPPPSVNDQELATRAPVEGSFPATFTLRLYKPPPWEAIRTLAPGEVSWARANAAAVPYGVAAELVPNLPAASNPSYTFDASHWVIHLEADVPSNSLTAWWLGGALPAGYHLVRVSFLTQCLTPPELAACVAELVQRGVPDDGTNNPGTARGYCLAPYRLQPTTLDEAIVLQLGQLPAVGGASCP